MKWTPKPYMERAVQFLLTRGAAGLFLNPGRAKTAITLAAVSLLRQHKQIRRALVVCPINPMSAVWPVECAKWEFPLGWCVLHGDKKDKRLAEWLANPHIHLFIVNYEGLKWFVGAMAKLQDFPFDMLIVDESSYVRDKKTLRWRLLKPMLGMFKRRVILTGDPAPNSLIDLWAQVYVMDRGATFGPHITKFRLEYFDYDFGMDEWVPKPDTNERMRRELAPRVLTMTEEDQEGLPEITYNTINFTLPPHIMAAYRDLKRNLELRFADGRKITAANAGIIVGKLQQFTGGAVYQTDDAESKGDEGGWIPIHDAKLDALKALVGERQGRGTVVVYHYKHELIRIMEHLPGAVNFKSMPVVRLQAAWNAGRIATLVVQEQEMSHGLNFQDVEGHIVWFHLTTSNERYRQLVRRIYRTGQKHPVVVHHLVAEGTWDVRAMLLVGKKAAGQAALLAELRAYWEEN